MLKSVLLIFDPVNTWDKIEQTKRSALAVLFLFVLPLLILSSLVEGYGLLRFGRIQQISGHVKLVPQAVVLRFEVIQLAFAFVILFGVAWLLKRMGKGFYRGHTYSDCFMTVAYSLGPFFLIRMFNAAPFLDSWICWGVGILLAISSLYRGIPRIMKPDPSNALGLYLMASLLFLFVTGLGQFVALMVLDEKIWTKVVIPTFQFAV
jgi:hypothetical protein